MTTIVRRRALGITSVRGIVAASTTGISFANNYQRIPEDNVYIRWGCTSELPNRNAHIINNPSAIHRVANKRNFRVLTANAGLAPRTWTSWDDTWFTPAVFPLIIRKTYHAQGRGLWVVNTQNELQHRCTRLGSGNYYISELINKVAEYRVFVLQGKVVWVAQKTPGNPEAVAWNVARGGRFDNVGFSSWPVAVVKNAIAAMELSGLHFGGVDVMVDAEGRAYCLEINSAPSQTSPYRQGCVARAFDYMVEHGDYEVDALSEDLTGYTKGYRAVIHPALEVS